MLRVERHFMLKYWLRYQSSDPFFIDDPWIDETIVTVKTEQEAEQIANQKSKETGLHYAIKKFIE